MDWFLWLIQYGPQLLGWAIVVFILSLCLLGFIVGRENKELDRHADEDIEDDGHLVRASHRRVG